MRKSADGKFRLRILAAYARHQQGTICGRNDIHAILPAILGRDLNAGRNLPYRRTDSDFDVLAQRHKRLHKTLKGDSLEFIVADGRDSGLRYSENFRGFGLTQFPFIQQLVEPPRQPRSG
jgi:hypothetical protein